MSPVYELVVYATTACALQKRRKRKLKTWTKQWFQRKNNLLTELRCYPKDWTNYLRMDEPTYLELLSMVTPFVKKQDSCMRKAITPNERLMVTLRYLATGRTLEDLTFSCCIAPQTLGKTIPDTCEAIFKALRNYCKLWNKRVSDGGVFEASDLSKKLEDGSLNLPKEGTVARKNMRATHYLSSHGVQQTERWHIAGSACRQVHTGQFCLRARWPASKTEGIPTGQQSKRFTRKPPHTRQFCLSDQDCSGRSEGRTVRIWWALWMM
ncbi:hypothetical protein PR048_008310 [Dryococelus australis]|uniref:Transposase n=1 Tax=Dryococelus australis TaxID=614101 RepID=A0ABQ9HXJ1_9NEOP|nr:hypothetical protein PR048_008310 [Dryococelus australis]